ncbi:MAG: beta-aspartyl-peptidase [Pseudomonadota bacterium]
MLQLIRNAQVFAPTSLGIQNLLIGGGKILWMDKDLPDIAPSLLGLDYDAEGRRLIPGFIDGHAHVTGGGGESGYASRVPRVPLSAFTQAGVSTVVGLLGTDDSTRDTASLLAQVRALREEGMNAFCYTGGYHVPPVTFTGCVRRDIVAIDPIIGVGELAISDHRSSQPQLHELLRIASDAHVAGMMSGKAGICHLHLGDGERGLELVRTALRDSELPPRVFNPTHVNRKTALFAEAIDLASHGCFVDLTAFPVAEGEDAYSAEDGLIRFFESKAPHDRVTVSSDGGGCLPEFDTDGRICHMDIGSPGALLATLKRLLGKGVDLEQALAPFTHNPAKLLRLNDKGSIGVGQDADLLLLDDTFELDSVMINGQWHRRAGEQLIAGLFEQ